MYKITPTAILRKRGKWTESSEFIKLIAKERGVKERQAYNILKKALDKESGWFEEEIIKHVFSDRTIIYGLPEFGPPVLETAKDKISANLGFFGWLEQRDERKRMEQERKRERRYRQERVWDAGEQLQRWRTEFKQKYYRKPSPQEEWEKIETLSKLFKVEPSEILTGLSK